LPERNLALLESVKFFSMCVACWEAYPLLMRMLPCQGSAKENVFTDIEFEDYMG
jgi:hypothetical protein